MARKFTHIATLLQYLHLSLTCMCEAWEDILMQMDQRLTKFVQVGSRVFFFFLVGLEHGQHSTDKSTSPKLLLGEKHKHSSSGRISGTFTVGSVKVRKLEITFVAV